MSFNRFLEKTITKSQRCQRNWDLSKSIPTEDVKTMQVSVTQCSSKQNRVFYKTKFITNRSIIEEIHENTVGARVEDFNSDEGLTTNPQTLANLVVIFCEDNDPLNKLQSDEDRIILGNMKGDVEQAKKIRQRDADVAIGIGSAYLTLTANMLGYATGCCQCFDEEKVSKAIGGDKPLLIMGIGYPDSTRSRLEHHVTGKRFPSFSKHVKVEEVA